MSVLPAAIVTHPRVEAKAAAVVLDNLSNLRRQFAWEHRDQSVRAFDVRHQVQSMRDPRDPLAFEDREDLVEVLVCVGALV
jgi:hypothetical protein